MITVKNLYRTYTIKSGFLSRKKEIKSALTDVNFSIDSGEIFGLLGPNGAGKTTTMKIMTTLLLPTSGEVKIFGLDVTRYRKEIQNRINFIYGGERSLYWRLTAKENLMYFSDLYNVPLASVGPRVDELLSLVGLSQYSHQKVETFSKGMKQRLQIARALINNPDIIFMDEPTIGLDPAASNLLHEIILELKSKGKTIVLTTHYMKEAEQLCDRIAFIDKGKLLGVNTPQGHIQTACHLSNQQISDLEEVYLNYFGHQRSVG